MFQTVYVISDSPGLYSLLIVSLFFFLSEDSSEETFDVKNCRGKLAEHYKRTATVPTSVWSKTSPVDIHQIYTRLSWVKEEQTPAGSSQSELSHYTDVFTANENGVVPKRILVQGQTGIGKSTFVKKLAVDWAELDYEKTENNQEKALKVFEGDGDVNENEEEVGHDDKNTSSEDDEDRQRNWYEDTSNDYEYYEVIASDNEYEDTSSDDEYDEDMSENQKKALKKFELVVVINLKEVSKCPSLKEVLCRCNILPDEEKTMTEGLLSYITQNQEKVLLVFDGYDEYRCGTNSEIYEIFRGKKLRNCCVLITTRISKADELREFKDTYAEITGFSEKDRKTFMRRMLHGKAEAKELRRYLSKKNLTDLTRVPLLLLFFCTLWKKGKLESIPENKTKLYLAIVQYVLDYSQGKHSPARFGKVEDFKEILAEIGQLALECLLNDNHVFEYDQLSAAILGEQSLIIGLLQVTEYAENLRPAGMVSFIHKSIQEFLAAWYITYKCVPFGNLGGIEERARTLEDCLSLENVFQFICGLSDEGAVKVFQHFASVRISDPTLDLSKTIPDVENETDAPLCDVTNRHRRFSDLVYKSFRDVHSKTELFINCFECTGRIVLVTEQVIGFLQEVYVKDLTQVTYSGVFFSVSPFYFFYQFYNNRVTDSTLYKLIEALDCLEVVLSAPHSSEVLTVGDFVRKFRNHDLSRTCECSFRYILFFHNGQLQFYITDLKLHCDDHARLLMKAPVDSVPSLPANLSSGQLRLKFLRSLECGYYLSGQTWKAVGAAIRNCKHLNRIEAEERDDSVCDLLEQVPKSNRCSLSIGSFILVIHVPVPGNGANCHLTSAGAVKLASLLPRFNIITLCLNLRNCSSAAVDLLISSITHKSLETLALRGVSLTPAAAAALGRSLPEMPALETLELTGVDGSVLEAGEMDALFGRIKKTLPLSELSFGNFSVRGCLAPLIKTFRFFPNLSELSLDNLHMDEQEIRELLKSLKLTRNSLKVSQSGAVTLTICWIRL